MSTDKSFTCVPTTALTWLMSLKNLEEQTARWIQPSKSTISLPRTVKTENIMPISFRDDRAEKNVLTAINSWR
jgi:hypothetical protein